MGQKVAKLPKFNAGDLVFIKDDLRHIHKVKQTLNIYKYFIYSLRSQDMSVYKHERDLIKATKMLRLLYEK